MNRSSVLRLAVIGAVAALVLAGCGRKGPLDPPPGATAAPPPAQSEAPLPRPLAEPDTSGSERPVAPPGEARRLPLDWLID